MSTNKEFTSEDLSNLLNGTPGIKSDFNMLIIKLKRRQLTGSQQCARATLEIIRNMIGRFNFISTDHMMKAVRAMGRELMSAAQTELTIGNVVRRILFFIREEHINHMKSIVVEDKRARSSSKDLTLKAAQLSIHNESKTAAAGGKSKRDRSYSTTSVNSNEPSEVNQISHQDHMKKHHLPLETFGILNNQTELEDFNRHFPSLKAAVLSALAEMSNEIDNVTAICQRAQDFIHADECILTYGYSKIVELFLKTAGAKRRFQLIIAEGAPSLDGHKLAQNLSKVPSISIIIIPDSNIYALMARVNKVILSPQAIMADGGAISNSGHTMVAVAAKEFSVPVVCVSGSFSLTPVYAHNQSLALQQLLSPCSAIPYNADISFGNVEVSYPAFDHLTPDLISLYVTNDGNQLPSYVFRQLSEYYHPKDYIL